MQAYTVQVVSKVNPIEHIMTWPIGRLAKWAMTLKQYDLVYVPQKAIKGQVLANFLADHAIPDEWKLNDDLSGEDVLLSTFSHLRKCTLMELREAIGLVLV